MVEEKKFFTLKVHLNDRKPEDEIPPMALYLMSPAGSVQKKLAAVKDSKIDIMRDWKKHRGLLAFGPDVKDIKDIRPQSLAFFHAETAMAEWSAHKEIGIAREDWRKFFFGVACVKGSVRKCFYLPPHPPWPPWPPQPWPPWPPLPPWHKVCVPICQGVVEIYERVCCCREISIIYPLYEELLKKLKELLERWPPIPWPPIPWPPEPEPPVPPIEPVVPDLIKEPRPIPEPIPGPIDFKHAEIQNIKKFEAETDLLKMVPPSPRLAADLVALKSMPRNDGIAYIEKHPYLVTLLCFPWKCKIRKVGEAFIRPDGSFSFCYRTPPIFYMYGMKCKTTYYYKVKQWQDNQWVYIYDGGAAYDYFMGNDYADLEVWNHLARACEPVPEPPPHDKPYVMLETIGHISSHRLVSPVQNAEMGINSGLPDNAGLVDPPSSGVSALGKLNNRPWAKTLRFRLLFQDGMKNLGAKYYRISIVGVVNSNGNPPSGAIPRPLISPLSWSRFEYINNKIQVTSHLLGPHTLTDQSGKTQTGLYEIPYYNAAKPWRFYQFHNYWDTSLEENGKHLVIVEVFDEHGNRLRPNGSAGDGIDKNFDFIRQTDDTNLTPVPFAALTHIFWTDKQPCYGDIVDLRVDGTASTKECQFLTGTANTELSVGYKAYHVNGPPGEPFMHYHNLRCRRGLNGPYFWLVNNKGENAPTPPTGATAESNRLKFQDMLAGLTEPKCSFSLFLNVYAKHTNGSRRIDEYDRYDQGAFALEITP